VPSCAEGGVLGILPEVIGLIQATETIKIILGKGRTLSGRLLLYNALDMTFKELKLRPNPVRPVIDKLIDYEQFCGIPQANPMTETQVPEITVQELKQIMDHRLDEYLIVDVRNPNEWEITRLPHTVLIPLPEIENGQGVSKIQAMLNGRKVAVHCRTGGRSAKAVGILQKAGIDAVNVKGGVHAWSDAIDPTVPKY